MLGGAFWMREKSTLYLKLMNTENRQMNNKCLSEQQVSQATEGTEMPERGPWPGGNAPMAFLCADIFHQRETTHCTAA